MTIEKILIVDDEIIMRNFLAETLRRKKIDVTTAENGNKAVALLKENTYDLVITDMKMPDLTGIDILRKVKELSPHTVVVVITAFGSIENAVEAMRLGAFNYLIKPFSPDTIEAVLEKAQEHLSLVHENQYLRQLASPSMTQPGRTFIFESPAMKQVMNQVMQVAKSNASIFIHGESGTGKEVVAHAIHTNSPRANRPFIKVNCAAVPESLIESEFFGHEKGSFTGATARRLGRFELANGGTLLLDEITETPPGLQAKLLRVTQEQEFERIGGSKPVKVDVRLISTSNRDMKEAIAQKMIREDLYYRLDVVPIYLPPLRDRKEDIIPLANYFLEKIALENHRERKNLTEDAHKKLLAYAWPGNIRELSNVIERAVVMDTASHVSEEHLFIDAPNLSSSGQPSGVKSSGVLASEISAPIAQNEKARLPGGISLQELEKQLIIETLQAQQNNRALAAKILGISTRKLTSKIEEYNLQPQ
ncbi:MAG TPA: sigma-54 dependent transcriptional regulator [Parachlamydiaceae bacterium]|nr:sigma-54 dependent transcriptional regulator [Parachlamydiaceae bacterium]